VMDYPIESFKREIDEFIDQNGQTFIIRHATDVGTIQDLSLRGAKTTTNPDRSLADSVKYYSPGIGNEEYARFIFNIDLIDFFPRSNDIVFEPLCENGYVYVPIKLLNVYRISRVDFINFDDTLLFLILHANREELGKWTTILGK